MIDIDAKGQLRRLVLSKRDALSPYQREKFSDAAAARLLAMKETQQANIIMCYRSFRSELTTEKIVENLLRQGKTLCFPLCKKGGIMEAYAPFDENSWTRGMMGITEPIAERSRLILPEEIELIICPMVAFDVERRRMGYGGGYYDRYLPKCKKALRLGIAFEAQRLDRVPTDDFDLAMDIIVTEKEIY